MKFSARKAIFCIGVIVIMTLSGCQTVSMYEPVEVTQDNIIEINSILDLEPYLKALGIANYEEDNNWVLGSIYDLEYIVYQTWDEGYTFSLSIEKNEYNLKLINKWNEKNHRCHAYIDNYDTNDQAYILVYFLPLNGKIKESELIKNLLIWQYFATEFQSYIDVNSQKTTHQQIH
ncbi:hypothetical protein C0W35_21375 [Photobacterium kishitanii]|uniref:hypothetical protein n=1 Tax=Photobacterium kishitanii TaxID=318456 RepID=UPI000D1683A4|nr:hypothetical protein [Photobacterium kishitanii]PSU87554.1 hypothetical protein C0W35_21375 [Photobacterium kishitanii]